MKPVEEYVSFDELVDDGLLWAINRYIFHPRGMALMWGEDHEGDYFGMASFSETVQFDQEMDDDGMERWESFLNRIKEKAIDPDKGDK